MKKRLSRRELLISLATVGTATGLGLSCRWLEGTVPTLDLHSMGPWLGHMKHLGEAYLETSPNERQEAVLLYLLSERFAALPRGTLAERARQSVRFDFEAGDTFEAHGWVLSRTEGRLAALTLNHPVP